MPRVEELQSLKEWERVAAHSHITGLGLEGLKAKKIGGGMVGQIEAREAAGIVVKLVKEGKFAGRAILIAGPPGTGKTALAIGIAKELGKDVPFVPLAASEIYSTEMKKTEFLTQALRKAIGVRVREMRKVYEGVVKDLNISEQPNPYNPYMKIPTSARITLATKDEEKMLSVDQDFAMQIMKQNVEKGDVIQIDVDGGRIVKLGKSEEAVKEQKLDITSQKPIPIPSGKVMKEKEFVYVLTLHEMDVINSKSGMDIFSLMFGGKEGGEIDSEIRKQIDSTIKEWVESGKAEIIPGVVFIDECSLLDIEAFAFLNRAIESELSPIIIFATNRGITKIRGTDIDSPRGMPIDLLDRLLIINTKRYDEEEIRKIIEIKANAERIKISKEALSYLTSLGVESSLRYAVQLIAPSLELAKEDGKEEIAREHVEKAKKIFADVKKSVKYLQEFEKSMLK
ncbi:MAG TPA: AAA family ATPase [Candidatus Aenigmarchaeota archaeon]|nr:AAA family ATPase [Candidatus Aenigmarchaeota archaeon]